MDAKVIGAIVIAALLLLAAGFACDEQPADNPTCPQGWRCDERGCYPVQSYSPTSYSPASYAPASQMFGGSPGWLSSLETRYVGAAQPAVDLPEQLRKQNWGGGSCVHASTITLLRWLADGSGNPALYDLAANWPYSGGENSSRHRERVEAANLRYVMTVDGDEELIKWAIATRRGCAIAHGGHCYNVVGYDQSSGEIITLDNNHTQRYDYTAWGEKIRQWAAAGGWAFAFVYDPPAPLPTVARWR